MNDGELTAEQIATLTSSVDIDAPPPGTQPSALVLFGTNQTSPARVAADRYHRGLPGAVPLYAIGWEPDYAGTLVTRDNWPSSPDGRRRVIRESREVPRRVADGSYLPAVKTNGAWS